MKILVLVKRVIDPNVKVRIKSDGSNVETNNIKMAMNPFDEVAVEQAIQLKEAGIVSEILIVAVGPAQSQDVIRTAMAMGADRGILLETPDAIESLAVAKLLREVVLAEQPGLVVTGKQTSDDDSNQTGQILAGLLNWPQATYASKVTIKDGRLEVVREIDAGTETVSMNLPAVVTTDLRLNEPRFTTMPSIMKARRLPLAVTPAGQFGIDLTPRLVLESVEEPAQRAVGVRVKNVQELAEKIKFALGVV